MDPTGNTAAPLISFADELTFIAQFLLNHIIEISLDVAGAIIIAADPLVATFWKNVVKSTAAVLQSAFSTINEILPIANDLMSGQFGSAAEALWSLSGHIGDLFWHSLNFVQHLELVGEGFAWGSFDILTGGTAELVSNVVGIASIAFDFGQLYGEALNQWNSYIS